MSHNQVLRILRSASLFAGLEDGDLRGFAGFASARRFMDGEVLFRQGDPSDGMYIMARGQVSVRGRVAGDDEIELATLGAGEVLGELGLVDDGARNASAVAIGEVSTLFFSRRMFAALRSDARPAVMRVMRQFDHKIAMRIRAAAEQLQADLRGQTRRVPVPEARAARRPLDIASLEDVHLRAIPFFARLDDEDRARLFSSFELFAAPAGTSLYRSGQPPQGIFIVVRGALRVSLRVSEHTEEQVMILGPGRVTGHLPAFSDPGVHHLRCTVCEDARLLHLPADAIDPFLDGGAAAHHTLREALTEESVQLLRRLNANHARLATEGLSGLTR